MSCISMKFYIPDSISDSDLYMPTTFTIIHVARKCLFHNVTMSAEREDGSTPGARVTWSSTVPPECVASVTVEFRSSRTKSGMRSYTTNNTSVTEVIQTGLQCSTIYYITVSVTGVHSLDNHILAYDQVDVTVGGKVTACVASLCTAKTYDDLCAYINFSVVAFHRYTNPSHSESCSHCRQHQYQSVVGVVTSGCAHVP